MKKFFRVGWFFLVLVLMSCTGSKYSFQTDSFLLELNEKGSLESLTDKESQTNYLPKGELAPLLTIKKGDVLETPSLLQKEQDVDVFSLRFDESGVKAKVRIQEKDSHLTFELISIAPKEKVDVIIWGPYPTTINETVGETVGVVRDGKYAIGIQALNVKTLGGYPTLEDDTEPAYDIFASSNLVDVSDSVKVLYRGQTARHTEFGSVLQAYCRDRSQDCVIKVWDHAKYFVPAFQDGGVIGSKIALFGCKEKKALETIGEIEIAEGLPHPMIDGEWGKETSHATASYLIQHFTENNIEDAIELTKKAGLKYLYHGGPFETWGHFKLQEKAFPENWESMRKCVEVAKKHDVRLGLHTLSNFITTNDPYVTPIPDKRLAKVGESKLTGDIDGSTKEISIADPTFFNQMKNNNLHAVVVGDEIIRYAEVSESQPWKLLECERGAFGTKATSHQKGQVIGKLMDHGYKTFLTNNDLSDEVAKRIADLFNQTGLMQVSFDGLEGNWSTGMGQYGRQRFVKTWYDHLKPELKGKVINDASNPGHYFWHIYTRMNWGEPWYAGFRESQTQYRLMNQDFYRRNLMPCMLGWFQMSSETSLEDIEWLLARSAGFDAGFALVTSKQAVEKNGNGEEILELIKQWEKARIGGAFSDEQKKRLENIHNEFRLTPVADKEWDLQQIKIQRVKHKHIVRQPGEPVFSKFKFENPYARQPLCFIISAPRDVAISEVTFEIDNFKKVELPLTLSPNHYLKYEGGTQAVVYDQNWKKVKSIFVDPDKFIVSQGEHSLIFDCGFKGGKDSVVKIEVKTFDEAEKVTI